MPSKNTASAVAEIIEDIATFPKNAREEWRVNLQVYRGVNLIQARAFVEDRHTGDMSPTRSGLSIRPDQIDTMIAALQSAREAAVGHGWLSPHPTAPKTRPNQPAASQTEDILVMRREGIGVRDIARRLGMSAATVSRRLKTAETPLHETPSETVRETVA